MIEPGKHQIKDAKMESRPRAITAFYNPEKRDWDQAMDRALEAHGLKPGDCNVICLPKEKQAET